MFILLLPQISSIFSDDNKFETTSGVIQGEYNLIVKMKYVSLSQKVEVGDIVITSGLEENIRRGIIIGEVAEINKNQMLFFKN